MYGAMLGDIIGSRFEFDRGGKTKDFKLFTDESLYTDDSVMTVAVAEALLNSGRDADTYLAVMPILIILMILCKFWAPFMRL